MSALKFVGKHMKRHKGKIIISLVLSIVISLVSSLGPYIMKLIVDVGIPEGRIEYEIFVCNKDWLDLDENSRSLLNRRLFGIAAEEFPLIEFMTIEENISMPSLLDGDKTNIEELVKAFDIGYLLQKYPSDLNHREEMRCICARAFSGGRKVVVIFDLFKRMQEQSKAELAILTYHAAKSLGISALYISEDLDENYGAYDFIYKYRPEKKEFSIIDFRA